MTGYLDKVIRILVLVLPKMSGYVKIFKVKDGVKNNKLMSFHINDEELWEKYKTIWVKIEVLKNIELNAAPIYADGYIKTKIRTCSDNFYTKFCSLNVTEDAVECESFKIISFGYLLVYDNKFYQQVYLDNCAYKTINTQIVDYRDDNLFKNDED